MRHGRRSRRRPPLATCFSRSSRRPMSPSVRTRLPMRLRPDCSAPGFVDTSRFRGKRIHDAWAVPNGLSSGPGVGSSPPSAAARRRVCATEALSVGPHGGTSPQFLLKESATESTQWWPPRVVPSKGAANFLLIMTDDQGSVCPHDGAHDSADDVHRRDVRRWRGYPRWWTAVTTCRSGSPGRSTS